MKAHALAFAAHDVRLRTHRTGNDAKLAEASTNRAFACHEHVRIEMPLRRDVVVVAVHGVIGHGETGQRVA